MWCWWFIEVVVIYLPMVPLIGRVAQVWYLPLHLLYNILIYIILCIINQLSSSLFLISYMYYLLRYVFHHLTYIFFVFSPPVLTRIGFAAALNKHRVAPNHKDPMPADIPAIIIDVSTCSLSMPQIPYQPTVCF